MPEPYQPFTATPGDFWRRFGMWQQDVEERFLTAAKFQGMDDAVVDAIIRSSPSNSDLLSALPFEERKSLLSAYRGDVLGFDSGYIQDSFRRVGRGGNGLDVGRFVMDETSEHYNHPLSYVLRHMSFQHDPTKEGMEAFSFGGNIPRMEYAQAMKRRSGQPIAAGKSIFVFDTETLGLATEMSSVREVSGVSARMTSTGMKVDVADVMTKHMKVARAGYGAIYDGGAKATIRMDKFIDNISGGNIAGSAADGRQFIESVLPILEKMKDSDFIAGHNVKFDIGQIVTNAMKTSDYLNGKVVNGTNVKSLVDSIVKKIGDGQVLDSLNMASDYFHNSLKLAPEFAAMGKPSPFSLENLMLQTNLSTLLDKDMPGFMGAMNKAQHQADVDTVITAKLIEYMQSGSLKERTLGANGKAAELALRHKTLTSYAPTPVSNITDVSHISPELFDELWKEGDDSLSIHRLLTGEKVERSGMRGADWYKILTEGDQSPFIAVPKVTPMEQHIFETNQVLHAVDQDVGKISSNLGQWASFSKFNQPYEGVLNRLHTLFKRAEIPDDNAFGAFQRRMAAAGNPFSGISLEERIITGSLATAAKQKSTVNSLIGEAESRAVAVGDDLGISRFAMRDSFYQTRSGVTSIPLDVLKKAEEQGIIDTAFNGRIGVDRPQMLSLSTVESRQNVNLMVEMSEDSSRNLVNWMQEHLRPSGDDEVRSLLRQYDLNQDVLDRIRAGLLDEGGFKHGINIGHLDEAAGTQAYHTMNDLLQGLTRDTDKIPFRVGYMSESGGVIRTGAAILDRFRSDEQKDMYTRDLGRAEKRAAGLIEELPDNMAMAKAKAVYAAGGSEELALKAEAIHGFIKKRGPALIGAAAVAIGGYYGYKKYKEQKGYDESMQHMDYESDADYGRYRHEMGMGPAPAVRRQDPLATAGVVGNLHNNAIGHTNMNSNRYGGLFAGI